ncbi:MAG TPA: PAS domain S-box protein, partial [Thermoanaerobaculia bacterium]
ARGHEAIDASDGLEALEQLRSEKLDAVISDILMPRMDGYRLCYEIRSDEKLRSIPIIIYSATYTSPADERLALGVGADRFIRKPTSPSVILEHLEDLVRRPRAAAEVAPFDSELEVLREYSERLVQKLESKNIALQAAKEQLEVSERRFRELADQAPIGIYRSTRQGRFVSVNPAFARILGYDTPEDVLRLDITRDIYFDAGERDRLIADNQRLGGIGGFEVRLKRQDGSPVWVRLDSRAIRDESGELTHFEGFVHEIQQRKRAEEALKQSEERFRRSFALSPIGMSLSEAKAGRLVDVNETFARLLGFEREELIGRTSVEMGIWNDLADRDRITADVRNSRLIRDREVRLRTKSGDLKHVLGSVEPLRLGEEQVYLSVFQDITERKKSEQSIQRLLRAVEQAQSAIFMTDPSGEINYVNPAFEKIYGYSKEEALGKTPRILKGGQRDQAYYESFWQRLLAGESVREEFVNRRRDGRLVTMNASISPVLDERGDRVGFIAVQEDVTESKRSEEALLKSERRFSLAFQASPVPTSIREVATERYLDVNEQFVRTLGFSREELIGRTPVEVGLWVDPDAHRRATASVSQNSALRESELQLRTKSGAVLDVLGSFVRVDLGSLSCILSTFVDVTERQRAERQSRINEERFRRLLDSNTIGIFIADLTGRTFEANDAFLNIIGYSREELFSGAVRWDEITPEEHRERDQIAVEQLRTVGVAQPWEKEYLRKDGTRVPVLIGVAMLGEAEGRCMVYILDLSSQKQLEQQLRQSQKMEAIGQLAGGVAHDFNNLLTAILGYSDLLTGRVQSADLQEAVDEIKKAGERAAALTRQLLAFSRKQVLSPEVLDLNRLIENLEKMLRRLIGEHIELTTRLSGSLWRVRADAGQVEQVILNLAVNARDAMPKGGKLVIETANVALDDGYARIHPSVRPGRYVMIAVSDSGVGMTAETQAKVFEPFFTTKKTGTGLGLATVYGIVKQSGGNIWVYSELGRGTTLKVYFPQFEGDAVDARPKAAGSAVAGGSETILIVEDEASVRSLARRILEKHGYSILAARNGAEALEIAEGHPAPIHLLLTDLIMPGMAGPDLAAQLTALRPQMRVLFMSGYTDDSVVRDGLVSEKGLFLQKPFTPDGLARKVREALS